VLKTLKTAFLVMILSNIKKFFFAKMRAFPSYYPGDAIAFKNLPVEFNIRDVNAFIITKH